MVGGGHAAAARVGSYPLTEIGLVVYHVWAAAVVAVVVYGVLSRRGVDSETCCRACGYDLTGNLSGRCPECGSAA